MKYLNSLLCVSLCLSAPALAAGQQAARPAPSLPQMYEDIEVMRRLLARAIHKQQMSNCTACHSAGIVLRRPLFGDGFRNATSRTDTGQTSAEALAEAVA